MKTAEEWRPIPGWEGYYEASNYGRIRSCVRILEVYSKGRWYSRPYGGQIISLKRQDNGYLCVNLWRDNKGHMRMVHRLVCAAFNNVKDADQLVCNHINHIRTDNTASNLEFITQKQNTEKAAKHYGFETFGEFISERKTGGGQSLPKT